MAEPLRFSHHVARAYATAVLASVGFSREDASLCADLLVESSLRGIDSHGVLALLPVYAEQAKHGIGRASAAPAVLDQRGAVAVVSGGGSSGPRTARLALELAVQRARAHGVGATVARDLGYLGALGWIVLPAAEQGLIALATCDAMAFVSPFGGREALHGTNPIAIVVPAKPDPILLDMRTNAFQMSDWWESIRTSGPLPEGSLMRTDGSPVGRADEALNWDEIVSPPLAGPKGYGLALVVDVLTAGLAGSPIGREIAHEAERDGLAAFVLAIDPAFFGPPERFAAAVARLCVQVHETAPVNADVPVRLPGERSAAERRQRLARGIPVDPQLWDKLQQQLAALDVDLAPPRLRQEGET